MNSLGRDIQKGERVVLRADQFAKKYQALKYRIFIVESGYGMFTATRGTALYGYHEFDGEKTRWEGHQISVLETKVLQEEGKNASAS